LLLLLLLLLLDACCWVHFPPAKKRAAMQWMAQLAIQPNAADNPAYA
jgi:hypothetical protein